MYGKREISASLLIDVNRSISWKVFEFIMNTWNHTTVCKQMIIIK